MGSLPIKLSPHQIGIQEVLSLAEFRGRIPEQVTLFGIIPQSYEPGVELTPLLAAKLPALAELVVAELREAGHVIQQI